MKFLTSQQQIGVNRNNIGADNQAFSIRKFVLAIRQKDVVNCWPFSDKYLQICLKHGIDNVLPPLEPHESAFQSHNQDVKFNFFREFKDKNISAENEATNGVVKQNIVENKNNLYLNVNSRIGSDMISDEVPTNQRSVTCLNVDQNSEALNLTNRTNRPWKKHKKRKGKCKKRSMVDILAVAKHCTSEDLRRIRRLCCGSTEEIGEGSDQTKPLKLRIRKGGGGGRGQQLKQKFSGAMFNSWNMNQIF